MTEIEKLIELCECEVVFDNEQAGQMYAGGEGGIYAWGGNMILPNIKISPTKSEADKLAILAHETGHALCEKNKCRCEKGVWKAMRSTALSEYHAMKFASKWLLDNQCKEAMKCHIVNVESQIKYDNDPHGDAAKRLKKLKLWDKCKKFADS